MWGNLLFAKAFAAGRVVTAGDVGVVAVPPGRRSRRGRVRSWPRRPRAGAVISGEPASGVRDADRRVHQGRKPLKCLEDKGIGRE